MDRQVNQSISTMTNTKESVIQHINNEESRKIDVIQNTKNKLENINQKPIEYKRFYTDVVSVINNLIKEYTDGIANKQRIKEALQEKVPDVTDNNVYEKLLEYLGSEIEIPEIDTSKLVDLFKDGITFDIKETDSEVCKKINEQLNIRFSIITDMYQILLDIERESPNFKKFRMLYEKDMKDFVKNLKKEDQIFKTTDYFIPIEDFDKNKDIKQQLAKVLFRFINVDKLLNDLFPNERILKELFKTQLETKSKINEYNVYTIDDLYEKLIKMSENTTNFINENCNRPVKEFIQTLNIRLSLVNILIKMLTNTVVILKKITAEFNRYDDIYLSKEYIQKQKESNVITYVKLRCDKKDNKYNYNQRFQTFTHKNNRELIIGHNPYLGGDSGNTNKVAKNTQSNQYRYDAYGSFDGVFLPNEKNIDIAKKLTRLSDSLNDGKSICVIAYGASGAGKSSTLLYFRGVEGVIPPENGIIPNLCNLINPKYQSIKITAKELRANYTEGSKKYWETLDALNGSATFTRPDGTWKTNDIQHTIINYSKLHAQDASVCEKPNPYAGVNTERTSFGSTLGEFISTLIDVRLNCGTTNNPDSSRTHMLVFLKFADASGNGPTLVVADLAGVEKPFDCDSLVVLENFARNEKYYKNINQKLSAIMGGGNVLFEVLENVLIKGEQDTRYKDITVEKIMNANIFSDTETIGGVQGTTRPSTRPAPTRPSTRQPTRPISSTSPAIYDTSTVARKPISPRPITPSKPTVSSPSPVKKTAPKIKYTVLSFFRYPDSIYLNIKADGKDEEFRKYFNALGLFCKFLVKAGYLDILIERIVDNKITNIQLQEGKLFKDLIEKFSKGYIKLVNESVTNFESYKMKIAYIYGTKKTDYSLFLESIKNNLVEKVLDEIIKLEEYFSVLRENTTGVCETRTKEGYFITKSLNELRLLVRAYSSASSVAPSFITSCYPIMCPEYLDSIQCLPPFDSKLPDNFSSSILETMKQGGVSDIDNLIFCVFNVCNLTNNKETDPIRQIYSPLGDLLEPTLEALNKVHTIRKKVIEKIMRVPDNIKQQAENLLDVIKTDLNLINREKEKFINKYKEYKKQMEQVDLSKRPSDNIQTKYFNESKKNWNDIKEISNRLKNHVLSKVDKFYILSLLKDYTDLEDIKKEIYNIIKEEDYDNSTTLIGTMTFTEEISKLGRKQMKCIVDDGMETFKLNTDNYVYINGML